MPDTLLDITDFSPLFTKLLHQRKFTDPEDIKKFIHVELSNLRDPFLMKGMKEATSRIQTAIEQNEKILVHGDYDVDGVTGATLLARTLEALGAQVEVFLPDRQRDGYGVSKRAIEEGKENGVSLFMTVDCGITAREQMELANKLGLDVIIIDHHRIPEEGVPNATVILNPLQEDCPYPFKELSAAGLAFKLAQALLGQKAFEFLDLAALSTIGDVAPLKEENRIIVKHGLQVLSNRSNPGVKALTKVAGIRTRQVNVGHVGFVLGPRINAAGRMSSPEIAYRLLMTEHDKEADSLAEVLHEENKLRQKEERQTVKEAIAEVERTMNFNRDRVIVVGRQGWHAGVIGIVASRLVERYYRPALVIAFDGDTGKASARSIKGFHLYNALDASKSFLKEFGGHEQAAGFSMFEKNLDDFRKAINEHALESYEPETFVKSVKTDLEIGLENLNSRFVNELSLLEPHGMGNSRPVFLTKNLKLKGSPEKKYTGTYRFLVTDGKLTFEASWTDKSANSQGMNAFTKETVFDLAYSIKTKIWDGIESITLDVKQIKPQL